MPDIVMSESQAYIRFTKIPIDYDRKKLYAVFSKYGRVKKLYICPQNEYAKVYMENTEQAEKAYMGAMKTHSHLNLQFVKPKLNAHSNSFNDASGSITSNEDNGNIDTYVTKSLVDVFGRILTTLLDNDGNVYIPLNELKRSGFELFELGSLPSREGSRIYNQQQLLQFETYMKAKANEFISRVKCNISTDAINDIIEKEKRDFFDVSDHGVSSSNRRSYDNIKVESNKPKGFHSPRCNYGSDDMDSNGKGSVGNNNDEGLHKQNHSHSVKNRSFENPKFIIKQEIADQKQLNVDSNSITKEIQPLMAIPIKLENLQLVDNISPIKKVNSPTTKPEESDKLTSFEMSPNMSVSGETFTALRKPHSLKSIDQEINKLKKKRKLVIEKVCDSGIFQFCEKTGDNTFTGFALPEGYNEEFKMISELESNCTYDAKFTPSIGDIVAVDHDDDIARALILNETNGQYMCALIDYGTTCNKCKVLELPQKYALIPEFSFECQADVSVMQKLQQADNVKLSVKSPCNICLSLGTGEKYELVGKPIQLLIDEHLTESEKPVEYVEKESPPSVVAQQKLDVESNETVFLPRKLVIEDLSERGSFDFIEKTSDTTFTCFVCPEKFLTDLNHLEMIYKDTSVDEAFKPQIGDLVAANSAEDGVVRGVVLNILNNKYECALIDYGTIQWISDVRLLPEKYKNIPEFVCECQADSKILQDLENAQCQSMSIKTPYVLTLHLTNGKQHTVKGHRWNPTKLHMNSLKEKNICESYKRPPKLSLTDSDKVMVVGTYDNVLIVRNKECHSTFTAVCEELANYKGKPYDKPEVGCLAVCNFNDKHLYRVVVTKIDDGMVTLDYIDYGNVDSVPISELQSINEKLATMKSTLVHICLKDFTQHKFSEDMLKHLMNCSEKREKFQAYKVTDEENVYDLIGTDKVSLTARLNNLQKNVTTPKVSIESKPEMAQLQEQKTSPNSKSITSKTKKVGDPVCRIEDIIKSDVKPGDVKLLCTYVGNLEEGLISCCKADDETDMILTYVSEKILKCLEKDNATFYMPSVSEVVLAKFDDDWFRAAVVKTESENRFGVYFVDYGNHCIVDSKDIRKLPSDLSTTKALAMVCRLHGVVKENEKIVSAALLSRLKVDVIESEIYSATITSVRDNIYHIIIPTLQKQWKSDGLI